MVTHMVIFAVSLVLLLQKVISMLVTMFLFFCKWNSTRLWWTEQEEKYVGVMARTIGWNYPCQKKASSTHSLAPPAQRKLSNEETSLCAVRGTVGKSS